MAERVVPAENDVDRHAFPRNPVPIVAGSTSKSWTISTLMISSRSSSGLPPVQRRGQVASARRCQVAGVSAVSAVGTVLTPAAA
jgi:hypothetical protein